MPEGDGYGWGIAGSNLRRELALLPPLSGVTLHCIARHDFEPRTPADWNRINIGYCFFEHDLLAYHVLPGAAAKWDFIVAGSRWCEYHLRMAGVRHTTTILQGINPLLFSCRPPRADDGRFIVFSGGKFEFRKGQDIVIAAMRLFMANHDDVWLSCAWHNPWEKSIQTMEQSRLISLGDLSLRSDDFYPQLLQRNGIDLSRVLLHPPQDNAAMAEIYAASDIGLFPNRCEGGNNLVMSEYVACGRPVVASTCTGHADVLTPENAFGLSRYQPVICRLNGMDTGVWFEAAVDEVLAMLEKAYADRNLLQTMGRAAAISMQRLTWQEAARRFYGIARHLASRHGRTAQPDPATQLALAEACFNRGDYHQAELEYRDLLERYPLQAGLHNCLGTVLDRLGQLSEAAAHYGKALSLQPAQQIIRYNLANTCKRLGNLKQCCDLLREVVAADPDFIDAWQNLGACLYELHRYDESATCYEQVVSRDPARSGCQAALGEVYFKLGTNLEGAIECLAQALREQPEQIDLYNLKGMLHFELEQYQAAEQCYRSGLQRDPRNPLLLGNLANLELAQAQPHKAIMLFNLALESEPGNAATIFNRSLARLLLGDFKRGWLDYEARFGKQEPVVLRHQQLPRWQGEPLKGRRLLVWSEQVYGDTIQFARFIPLLSAYGGTILFECLDASLAPLFEGLPGIDQLLIRGASQPDADMQIPLLSLPLVLGTDLSHIPTAESYLQPNPLRLQQWKEHIQQHAGSRQLKVGLVWGGRKTRLNANRSLKLDQLIPLLELDRIAWFSLQTGDDQQQLAGQEDRLIVLGRKIIDFADTAAVLCSLDLLITIDTATAHLAGALGVPTWVLLKSAPDWRWPLDRNESPWYRSLRFFRQAYPGAWPELVVQVKKELWQLLALQ
jgi:tetratricopeptide (TPR) repeat protein